MKRAALLLALLPVAARGTESPLHKVGDDRIRQTMIAQSQHGACACPYTLDARARRCQAHSQYRRAAAARRPLCYATDISDAMVAAWRDRHGVHPPVP